MCQLECQVMQEKLQGPSFQILVIIEIYWNYFWYEGIEHSFVLTKAWTKILALATLQHLSLSSFACNKITNIHH